MDIDIVWYFFDGDRTCVIYGGGQKIIDLMIFFTAIDVPAEIFCVNKLQTIPG